MWGRKHALANACYSQIAVDENGEHALGAYMSTPVVVMDMKAIVEALSRLRTKSLSRCPKYTQPSKVESVDQIQYGWFSYETLIGETFAAIYPDFVGRMVLDDLPSSGLIYSRLQKAKRS